ncbi:MAG: hypothetical protein A3E25_01720 [Burkholderiales bacterium RIFCSPHIGHO2_12_FULL_69_20]|nr:MAG: hypothetical protein A3E25_01720 [Burkholderiales bacterium RIFCSPHIGHO2_12_FULL_69_20]
MKTTTKIIALTMAIASLTAVPVVFAHQGMGMGQGMQQGQGMGPGMMGHGPAMGPGMGMGRMAGGDPAQHATRMAEFKTALKITAEQEPAWTKFEATMRQQAEARQALRTTMQAQMKDGKMPADMSAQREAMQKLRAERDAARTELFAMLTPEQKALADRQGQGRHGRHGHRMAMQAPAK